jgi:glycosyltransferase involved in cell wall biosynthesis
MGAKKILIGLTYFSPNVSGVTLYAVILYEELLKRKYKVKIITSKYKKELPEKTGNIVRVIGFAIGKGFIMPTYCWQSLREVRKCDVVNCHLPSIESFWLALWAKVLKKKLVITHHCEFGIDGPWHNKLIGIITYPIHWLVYLMADKIISYTKDYADTSIFLRFFKKKLIYILPPIKIKKLKTSPKGTHFVAQNSKLKTKTVGYVGRIAWEKGLDVLVKAMKKVDAKLVLVGPYKELAGDKTYTKLKNVEMVGPEKHEDLNKYYEGFDCLVLPSTNNLETFGIVQAEAMVCGCPVVASNLPGVRVPVRMTGMGEIAKIGDVSDLVKKINIVLGNGKEYYQKKAINLSNFDYKKTIDQYEEIF